MVPVWCLHGLRGVTAEFPDADVDTNGCLKLWIFCYSQTESIMANSSGFHALITHPSCFVPEGAAPPTVLA